MKYSFFAHLALAIALLGTLIVPRQLYAAGRESSGRLAARAEGQSYVYLPLLVGLGGIGGPQEPERTPLTIDVGVEASRTVSGTITVDGGTLSATDASGTRYTLSIPPSALLSDEEIALTPVSVVEGLPFSGGLIAGIQIEPAGLRLLAPATLTITLAAPLPPRQAITISYESAIDQAQPALLQYRPSQGWLSNVEAYLFPSKPSPSEVTVTMPQVDGKIVTSGSQAERDAYHAAHRPSTPQAQAEELEELAPLPIATLQDQWNKWLSGELAAASTDDRLLDRAWHDLLHWYNKVLEKGSQHQEPYASYSKTGWRLLAAGFANAVTKAHQRCVGEHDLAQVAKIMRWIRIISQIPRLRQEFSAAQIAEMQSKVRRCAHFELAIDTTMVMELAPGVSTFSHLQGHVWLEYQSENTWVQSVGPFDYLEFRSEAACGGATTQGSSLVVRQVVINLNVKKQADVVPGVAISIAPGEPFETLNACYSIPSYRTYYWFNQFREWHKNEQDEGDSYRIAQWTRGTSSVFARKEYQRSGVLYGGLVSNESTTLKLIHVPLV